MIPHSKGVDASGGVGPSPGVKNPLLIEGLFGEFSRAASADADTDVD